MAGTGGTLTARETGPVAVVGAGIVGVATALWLQRAGREVVLIDRSGPAAGASQGNAGLLAASAVAPVTLPGLLGRAPRMLLDPRQPLFLRWRYLPRLLPWLTRYLRHANAVDARRTAAALSGIVSDSLSDHQALAEGSDAAGFVVPCDYLYVYDDRSGYEADEFSWGLRRACGFRWDEVEGAALRAAEPMLAASQGFALRLPDHGRITDPGAYVRALADLLESKGARMVRAEVEGAVIDEEGRVTGVRAGGEVIGCSALVLAGGAWSGPLARQLGLSVPMESERGYHLELIEPSAMPRAPMMIAAGKFVATPMEGRLRLAGVVEYGGLEAAASRAPLQLLRRNLARVFPGLTWKENREWMGHRPVLADSLPVIGPVPGIAGAYVGFGHQHIGLTAGARSGQLLAQMITGQRPNVDVAPFDPARFATATPRR